jgi:[pyruvate, water dikinase]-phosphate phosphotransferase / [pyruvate, water dikinase] kinase
MKKIVLYLISDCTGDTLHSVARASISRFSELTSKEKIYPMVRSKSQIDEIISEIENEVGIVMYTIVDEEVRYYLKEKCNQKNITYIPVLSHVVSKLSEYLDLKTVENPGKQYDLDEEYFRKVEAINFALNHDDGQSLHNLDKSDIIIIGPSRTSKSPTSVYLAYRGYKVANIPLVTGNNYADFNSYTKPLIVGLVINPDRLFDIRKNRLMSLDEKRQTDYIDIEKIQNEIKETKILCAKNNWPLIDVTRRSVEETAACILNFYKKREQLNER